MLNLPAVTPDRSKPQDGDVTPVPDSPDDALDMGATGCCADTARLLRALLTEGEV